MLMAAIHRQDEPHRLQHVQLPFTIISREVWFSGARLRSLWELVQISFGHGHPNKFLQRKWSCEFAVFQQLHGNIFACIPLCHGNGKVTWGISSFCERRESIKHNALIISLRMWRKEIDVLQIYILTCPAKLFGCLWTEKRAGQT